MPPKDDFGAPNMGWEYTLMETALAWGYRVGEWDNESVEAKARALAHYLLKGRLEGYLRDKAKEKAEREAKNKPGATPPPTPGWSKFAGFSSRPSPA